MRVRKSMILITIIALIAGFSAETFARGYGRGGRGGREWSGDIYGIRILQYHENPSLRLTDAQWAKIDKIRTDYYIKRLALQRKMDKLRSSNARAEEYQKVYREIVNLRFEQWEAIRAVLTDAQKKAIDEEINRY